MTYIRYILVAYSLITIFVSGGLFFKKTGRANLMLALFTLLYGLEILYFLFSTSKTASLYPQFLGYYYFEVGFLYGPLFLYHFIFFFNPDRRISLVDILHLIPLFSVSIYLFDITQLPTMERIEYVRIHFYDRIMPVNYFRAFHQLAYGIAIIFLILKSTKFKNAFFPWAICVIYFIATLMVTWLTEFADNWRQFAIYYLIACNIIILIAFFLYTDPTFLKVLRKKYFSSTLNDESMSDIFQKLERYLESEKPYLKNDLKLQMVAKAIDEQPQNISQALNIKYNTNFNELINAKRIDHAKSLFKDKKFSNYKIEAIALESGFNNKVTFSKAFKKFVNKTPSAYRDSLI